MEENRESSPVPFHFMEKNRERSPIPSLNSSPPPDPASVDSEPEMAITPPLKSPIPSLNSSPPPDPASVDSEPEMAITPPPGFPAQPLAIPEKGGKLIAVLVPQGLKTEGGMVTETAVSDFTVHVVTVDPEENVVKKILSFFHERGPKAVSILSATGQVSSVVISQSGAPVRYEGRFQILSLSGQCTITRGASGIQRENFMLIVSLAKPDGNVFGGVIEGSLVAATSIQLVITTFKQKGIGNQSKKRKASGSPVRDQHSARALPSNIVLVRYKRDLK